MKKILSLDGGGIRGIIPSMILMEIENRTGKRIAELFDLIGGTSTGGILSLGLTKPDANHKPQYAAKELLQLYETRGNDIFSRPAWKHLLPVGNVFGPKYSASGLEKLLKEYFGEAQLSDAVTQLVITSYDVERRQSYFFKSHKANASAERNFLMRDVARSTSAAPTYFPPNRLSISGTSDYYALVDGGVFANNPTMCAYVEARSIYKDEKDFLVVSVGTGENTKRLPYNTVKGWGLLGWAQPVIEVVFDGINDTIDYQLSQLMPMTGDDKRYYRFQITLNGVREDLDDCTPDNIRGLKLLGEELIRKSNVEIDAVCELLKK
ncbi:MAG: patatin-like phospholipase family protein [Chloroflexi bacterium]|nr:patatin-like phospholipase family protein [Chloroflexota bacterium]